MRFKTPRLFLLRKHRPKPRKERTPYYFTGLTPEMESYIRQQHGGFLSTFGRDYADEDPQFWTADESGVKPVPRESPTIALYLEALAGVMRRANHHPAHIHAMVTTRKIIFGCGTRDCHDMDECPRCNFRSVPEGWTKAWEQATRDYEKWRSDVVAPGDADIPFFNRVKGRG